MYGDIITYVYNLVNSLQLQQSIYPEDFVGKKSEAPFLKVSILLPRKQLIDYTHNQEIRGMVVFQIYTKSGQGQVPAATIADKLDQTFQSKTLGALQFTASSLNYMGLDASDNSLSRTDYSIPFIFFGV
jgi:hypothetical protein